MQDASEPPTSPTIFNTPRKRSAIAALATRAKVSCGSGSPNVAGDDRVDAPSQNVTPPSAFEVLRVEVEDLVHEPSPVLDAQRATTIALPTTCNDAALAAILDAPLFSGEPASVGFARKERALRDAFAELTIVAARALEKRLANPTNGDELAEKFCRLTPERKHRLLLFLADARRRAATSGKR